LGQEFGTSLSTLLELSTHLWVDAPAKKKKMGCALGAPKLACAPSTDALWTQLPVCFLEIGLARIHHRSFYHRDGMVHRSFAGGDVLLTW